MGHLPTDEVIGTCGDLICAKLLSVELELGFEPACSSQGLVVCGGCTEIADGSPCCPVSPEGGNT